MTVDTQVEKKHVGDQFPKYTRDKDGSYVFTDPSEFVRALDEFGELIPEGRLDTKGNSIKIIPFDSKK